MAGQPAESAQLVLGEARGAGVVQTLGAAANIERGRTPAVVGRDVVVELQSGWRPLAVARPADAVVGKAPRLLGRRATVNEDGISGARSGVVGCNCTSPRLAEFRQQASDVTWHVLHFPLNCGLSDRVRRKNWPETELARAKTERAVAKTFMAIGFSVGIRDAETMVRGIGLSKASYS
jgi:hypothetical protein